MNTPATRTVRCPSCGGDSLYAPANPFRPFCSERCKNVDLGAWANEQYRVEARPNPDEWVDGEAAPGQEPHR